VPQVVFDIGMNNGDDTCYYLRQGCQVIAVEANPLLCEQARDRFRDEIGTGRLKVENVGIASESGELTFWVSDHSVWSSFLESTARKGGASATPILVRTMRFAELLERHGTPTFLKVDIEGHDRLCIQGLSGAQRPNFVSMEMSHRDAEIDVNRLADELGYDRFRCVRQNDFVEITPDNLDRQLRRRQRLSHLGPLEGRIRGFLRKPVVRQGWSFPVGSSGPMPWEMPGPWLSKSELLDVWSHLHDIDALLNDKGLGEWFDIHATASDIPPPAR
jgi:FkbM family methyltransferase